MLSLVKTVEEHSSLVKNLKKKKKKKSKWVLKKTSFAAYEYDLSQTHITKRKKIKPKQDIHIE